MQNSFAKKLFAVGVAASTVLMSFAPLAAHAAAHAVGTNVKSSDGTIWLITPEGNRRAYTSAGAFLSYGFNSFSSVVDANAEDLALSAGSFIAPQDGKIFCATETKGSDVKGECSLITGGQKAAFTSAAVFTGLGFSFSRAMYGDSSFMTKTSNIDNTSAAHRPGVLVNNNGTVQLVGTNGLLGIPDLATFNSWGYSFADVVPANAADKTMSQTGVMVARQPGQLSPSWTSTPGTPGQPTSGSVSASLASDSPAGQTVAVHGTYKSVVTLAKFNFTGSGTVTQLQVKRIGVSADSALSNVYLFDGATRLTDAASVGGSSTVTFVNPTGLFMVNGSKTISVVAEIAGGTASGTTLGAQLISFTVSGASASTVAISGSLFTVSSTNDLAYTTFGTVTPSGATYDPAKDVEVFRSNVTVNTRDVQMTRFIVRNIGSAQQADINNFRLRVDGTQVAQTQSMDSNGYVYFSLSPMVLKSGSRVVSILADVIGGSSRNFQFQIRNVVDVDFSDTQYGVSVSSSNTFPVGSTSSNSISSGTMTIVKASDSPSGNVTDGSSDVTLAKYTVTAYGEPQKIETLKAGFASSNASVGSLRNGRILINGVQYGSTATLASSTPGGTQFTVNYTVQPGTPVTVEIHADMYDNDAQGNSLTNSDTVTASILTGVNNVQKMTSLGYNSSPSANVAGNAVTNVIGSVTLNKDNTYASQTVPLPQTNMKIADFNLAGSTSEDVTVSSIDIAVGASSTLTALNNVKVMVNGNMFGTVKSTVTMPGGSSTSTTDANPAATSTFSGNVSVTKGSTASIEVWADVPNTSAAAASDHFTPRIAVNGTAVNSSATIMAAAAGQQTSVGSASIAAAQDPSTPVAAITAGNQTKTAAAFKFTTANDQYTISELVISLGGNSTVQNIVLKDGATTIATMPGAASSTFSNLNIVVPSNSTKVLTVELQLGTVGQGSGTSGENVKVTLHSYKNAPSSTGTITNTASYVSGNNLYVYKSIPTLTNVTLPTTALTAGSGATLYKFSLSSGGTGTIGWTKLGFTIATSTNVTVSSFQVWDADANTQVTGTASTTYTSSGAVVEFNTLAEQQISGAKNYVLKATVGGTLASGAYVSTNIANPSTTFTSPTDSATASATTASLVWSDTSAQSHSLTTSDWSNDYMVKNLATDSQTLSKQ